MHDLFISYVDKDKEKVVSLANLLESGGLHIFFLAKRKEYGEPTRKIIDDAILSSQGGLIILTQNYKKRVDLESGWAYTEFNTLINRSARKNDFRVLYILDGLSYEAVEDWSPLLASCLAVVKTRNDRWEKIATEIITKYKQFSIKRKEEKMPTIKIEPSKAEKVEYRDTKLKMFQELYYLGLVYLVGRIYNGKRDDRNRKKIRYILSITRQTEDLILETLKGLDLIEQAHNLVTLKNKKLGKYILNELIDKNEINLEKVTKLFLTQMYE